MTFVLKSREVLHYFLRMLFWCWVKYVCTCQQINTPFSFLITGILQFYRNDLL